MTSGIFDFTKSSCSAGNPQVGPYRYRSYRRLVPGTRCRLWVSLGTNTWNGKQYFIICNNSQIILFVHFGPNIYTESLKFCIQCSKIGQCLVLFFFIFVFSIKFLIQLIENRFCQQPDLNCRSLVSEATALLTESQPLPNLHQMFGGYQVSPNWTLKP